MFSPPTLFSSIPEQTNSTPSVPNSPEQVPGNTTVLFFISRYLPEKHFGSGAHDSDFLNYLNSAGITVHFMLLEDGNVFEFIQKIPPVLSASHLICFKRYLRFHSNLLRVPTCKEIIPYFLALLLSPLWCIYKKLPERYKISLRNCLLRQDNNARTLSYDPAKNKPATPAEISKALEYIALVHPSVVVANYPFLSNLFEDMTDSTISKVIVTHDVITQRYESFKQAGLAFDGTEKMVAQEMADLRRADMLLACQEDDAALLREMIPSAEVMLMPISATVKSNTTPQIVGRCLFVGSATSHNITGLNWFFAEVWEKILAQRPQCHLHVCGNIAGKYQGLSYPNVTFMGVVDDIDAEYDAAEVCIAPILAGSGLKIKVVEAMAHQRAIVTTAIGVQGLSDAINTAVLLADTPEAFARTIELLFGDPVYRRCIEAGAAEYAISHFSPRACYQPFVDRIKK